MVKKFTGKMSFLVAVACAAIVGGSATALVSAAIPSANDQLIHGCYRNAAQGNVPKGNLRVVNSDINEVCATNETALNWNPSGGGNGLVSNLTEADFTGASLHYRNLAGLDLHNAIFNGANINGADFQGSNLTDTQFSVVSANKSNLQGANFSGSNFDSANLSGANLKNVNLTNTKIHSIVGGDFQGANFLSTSFFGSIRESNFKNVNFANAAFYMGSSFDHIDASGASFNGLIFGLPAQDMPDLPELDLNYSNFTSASFAGAHLGKVRQMQFDDFSGANLSGVNLTGLDFYASNMSTANVTGATWSNTRCPDDTNSDANGNTCIGHLAP